MIIYKCPSCGADIKPDNACMVYTCEHCGTAFSIVDDKDLKKIIVKIKQIKMALEECDFEKAEKICNRALNIDPENAEIYYLKLLSIHYINSETRMNTYKLFESQRSTWGISLEEEYKWAYQFGDDDMKRKLENLNMSIVYNGGVDWQEKGEYIKAYHSFLKTAGYKDSDERAKVCHELAEKYGNKSECKDSRLKNDKKSPNILKTIISKIKGDDNK